MTKFSFKGWEFKKWLFGNGKTIKEIVKVGIPYAISLFIVDPMWSQFLLTVGGKFILDTLEYWIKE